MAENVIEPIRLTDNNGILGKAGEVYTLDFNRAIVLSMEKKGLKFLEIGDFPATYIPEAFYNAFRMHHPNISRDKTDKLKDAWGGIPDSVLKRLIELYSQAMTANNIQTDEEAAKNAAVTVEL